MRRLLILLCCCLVGCCSKPEFKDRNFFMTKVLQKGSVEAFVLEDASNKTEYIVVIYQSRIAMVKREELKSQKEELQIQKEELQK